MPEAGERLVEEAAARIDAVERAVADAPRPRTAALEWLDPVYVGGHWVPQMIEAAGGLDVLGFPGESSRTVEWSEVEAVAPEMVISMPCGLYAEEAAAETMRQRDRLAPLGARVVAVDAAAYFSRPGPRLVDGVELLGHLLHPERVPAPESRRSIELDLAPARAGVVVAPSATGRRLRALMRFTRLTDVHNGQRRRSEPDPPSRAGYLRRSRTPRSRRPRPPRPCPRTPARAPPRAGEPGRPARTARSPRRPRPRSRRCARRSRCSAR